MRVLPFLLLFLTSHCLGETFGKEVETATCAQALESISAVQEKARNGRLPIVKVGNPTLREVASKVPDSILYHPNFKDLVTQLEHTMIASGGVGLAAPQVGIPLRIFVARYEGQNHVMVNPELTIVDPKKKSFLEGCLSIPVLCGLVRRPKVVRLDYLSPGGKESTQERGGFPAVVLQHEYDHLDGILFPDYFSFIRLFKGNPQSAP